MLDKLNSYEALNEQQVNQNKSPMNSDLDHDD